MKKAALITVIVSLLGITAGAHALSDEALAAARSAAPSIVRVEITLQYDKGQPPTSPGWGEPGQAYVEDERPLERAGYLLSPTRVLTPDLFLQPRFVEKIEVRAGDHVVSGRIAAHAENQFAMIVELDEPLPGSKPLAFDADAEGPYYLVSSQPRNGEWLLHAAPLPTSAALTSDTSMEFVPLNSRGVIVNAQGTAAGAAMNEELLAGTVWKGSPDQWPWISGGDVTLLKDATEAWAAGGILRAKLDLRSPQTAGPVDPWMGRVQGGADDATERHTLALLVAPDTVLVLENLRASTTARLERITVYPREGEPVDAKFAHSLLDYGAFLATLDQPLSGALDLAPAEDRIIDWRHRMVLAAEVMLHGEHRIAYFAHTRIPRFETGWRRHVYPEVHGDTSNVFLFSPDGRLLALPLPRRQRAGEERRWRHGGERLTPGGQVSALLADLANHIDESNVPLSEEEENRLAWLGVDLQELDEELARIYNASELTDDGSHGAIITFVYPNSPAADAGLEVGQILLRIHSPRHPRPLNVQADPYAGMAAGFPWHRLDEVPEEYFEHIPQPWTSANNPLNRLLTDLGFDTPFTVEVFHDGEVQTIDLTVVLGPTHFDSAKRFKSDPLGLTVRDLTYEVRRHFQKKDDDPGVIVSKIEPGSRASVGGLKPYEIVTHVNDRPIANIEAFEKAIEGQTEVRLGVQRMTRHRIVKIALDAPPAAQAAPVIELDVDEDAGR